MKEIDYEEGQRLVRDYVCGECGTPLRLPWGGSFGIQGHVVMCGQNPDHQGFTKPLSYTRALAEGKEIPIPIKDNIERKRRQRMTEQLGPETAGAVERYRGVTSLTQAQATEVLFSIWPKAPPMEVFKAALLCHTYGLNPLMKHVYLVPFTDYKTKEVTWTLILGIAATRLIASRKRPYGYVDGPRAMTKEEQETINGAFDPDNFWAITIVKDLLGNQAPGYGSWPRSEEPHGTNKGNTKANMARIRSERNALDKLLPGEMPTGVEVMDIDFLPAPAQHVEEAPPGAKAAPPGGPRVSSNLATDSQWGMIFNLTGKIGVKNDELFAGLKTKFGLEDPKKELTKAQASTVIDDLKKTQEQLPLS